jgi:flagellar assembly protein FliH
MPEAPRPHSPSAAAPPKQNIDWQARFAEAERGWEERAKQQYEAGRRDGMAAGQQAAAAAVQPVLDNLAASLSDLASVRARLRAQAEADVVKLAIAIARRVLRREIGVDPEALGALVRHAIERVNTRDLARVRTHPDHAAALRQILDARRAAGVAIESDASLPPGSVLFETAMGTLDASVDTQVAEIERGLADRLGGRA